jgi:transposase
VPATRATHWSPHQCECAVSISAKTELDAKKKSLHASQAETERVQNERYNYWQKLREIRPEDLIFIDETGVNLAMVQLYARSLKGTRAYGEKPHSDRQNITLIGAIGLAGFVSAMTIDGSINGDVFRIFVEKILVPNLWEGACVIMDNFSVHKVVGIRELIESKGAQLIYLPPYSPDFNPIENCWSKLKEYLRSVGARSRSALDAAIGKVIDEIITLKDINHWFAHDCYCTSII